VHRAVAYRALFTYKVSSAGKLLIDVKTKLDGRLYLPMFYYRHSSLVGLLVTIFLGILFTGLQKYEYEHATFTIADGIYGSTFFVTTGFHGLHVIIGTTLLIICFFRQLNYHFTREHHVGLEAAI